MTMIEEISIEATSTLLKALERMDSIKRKLLIVTCNSKFVGLLSIGDIQRAILANKDLSQTISSILREKITICKPDDTIDFIKGKMLSLRSEFMPIVNDNKEIIRVYFWEELFLGKELPPKKQFNLPVVIMAGGYGSRLKPLTNVLPKPLIPVDSKTIIEHIFDRFNNHGCTDFYLSVNYKAELIEYYLRSLSLPYQISYFREKKPCGTAGSLSLLKGRINKTFFVSNCDILIEQDYSEILEYHKKNNNEITIVSVLKTYSIPYGTIDTGGNGELISLTEKPTFTFSINSGMYILEPDLLDEIPEDTFFHITDLIKLVSKRKGKVGVFPVSENSWQDIGEWKEYLQLIR